MEISAVIPVYNEAENLTALYAELTAALPAITARYELIFVDDGSRDGSYGVLQELHVADKRVKVVRFRRNFGQTAAFAAGFDFAQGELIVTLDADGQNDPADIARLVEKLRAEQLDMVVGWRVDRQEGFLRRLLSQSANLIISRVTELAIHDRGCSLKVFRAELVKSIQIYGELHRFLPEMASTVGARVGEAPVNDRSRRFGKSKYGAFSRTPRVILDLITVFFLLGFFRSPMRLFGAIAIISGTLGVLIDGALALTKLVHGLLGGWAAFHAYAIGGRPLFFLGFLLILVSMQFLVMGLLGEMIMRTYYESQNKPIYFVREVLE
ncbi:MAG TPA: glycosyltransferase family 2 protein [Thermoflexia bacterium]|nr:glycosyltransferase family 2 protein [Thermoflexia bacterium]